MAYTPKPMHDLFGPWHGPEQRHIDCAVTLDRSLWEIVDAGHVDALLTQFDEVLGASHDDYSALQAFGDHLNQADVLDGPDGDYLGLARALRDRVARVASGQDSLPSDLPMFERKVNGRLSAFKDHASFARAQDVLVEANRDAVEAFSRNASGWDHLALYGDVGMEVGRVTAGGRVEHTTFPQSWGVHTPTTYAVVVLARDGDGGTYLDTSYPEYELDETVRATYPNLCQFFTLTYHQHRSIPVNDVRWTMKELRNPAWSAVRDELSLLLHVDDDLELRRIVEHCGSYLVPHNVRHRVDRLRWRFDAFDWHPDRDGVL